MLSVPGFDLGLLDHLYRLFTIKYKDRFLPVPTASVDSDWFRQPRSSTWQEIALIQKQDLIIRSHDNRLTTRPVHATLDDAEIQEALVDLFPHWWNSILSLRCFRLNPDGWVNPHRDLHDVSYGLCHFWLPLHNFSKPALKIFPLGWLIHEFGNLYLFNQSRFPHAVLNQESQARLVLIGKFDPDMIPTDLLQHYRETKITYRDLFYNASGYPSEHVR